MLFLAGIFFAAFAWILIPLPIGILLPQHRYSLRDIAPTLSGSILSLSGYFVWINWLVCAGNGRFVLRSEQTVQWIAIAGANTQGKTLEEARDNLREAVQMVLDANREIAERSIIGKTVSKEPFDLSAP